MGIIGRQSRFGVPTRSTGTALTTPLPADQGGGPTCWKPFLQDVDDYANTYPHQGRRAAEGQFRTQTVADPFLGWTRVGGEDFLVRQWSEHKASVDVAMLENGTIHDYAAPCGEVLAKAHARTGDDAMLSGYCGNSDRLDVSRFVIRVPGGAGRPRCTVLAAMGSHRMRLVMAMQGAIRGWDVLRHPVIIAQGFGLGALLLCTWSVVTGQSDTFLGIALAGSGSRARSHATHEAQPP